MWYNQTMEYYSALKTNEPSSHKKKMEGFTYVYIYITRTK